RHRGCSPRPITRTLPASAFPKRYTRLENREPAMTTIPRDTAFDSSSAFLQNGYNFIADRCRDYGSDIFQTRIMLRPVYCVTGEEAARMFYVPGRFTRNHAMPPTTLSLLQDKGSSLTLDGEEH